MFKKVPEPPLKTLQIFEVYGMLRNLHLNGTLGSQVGLKNLLEAFSSVNVDTEGGGLSDDVGLCVDELKRSHDVFDYRYLNSNQI
jgi:hypothetical protein